MNVKEVEAFCPVCGEDYQTESSQVNENGYGTVPCQCCKDNRSECCMAEIVEEWYTSYPLSENPLSRNYVEEIFGREVCEECGQEIER